MKTRKILFVLSLASIGCASSMQVRHEHAPGEPATGHASYAWVDQPVARHEGVLDLAVPAVKAALAERGYRETALADAGLVLTVQVLLAATEPNMAGPRDGSDVAIAMEAASQDSSHDKVLIVALQDRVSQEVVWLGWARAQVAESDIEAYAREAIPALVAGLPTVRR